MSFSLDFTIPFWFKPELPAIGEREVAQRVTICREKTHPKSLDNVLLFPQTIADNYLEEISEVEGSFPEGVTISGSTAKVTMIGMKFYKNGKQVNYSLGHIYDDFLLNFGAPPHFMYTNKPVVILGFSPDNGF